jgi:pSer/pThr/pTyr-binding forkhead associated (FHA) protein
MVSSLATVADVTATPSPPSATPPTAPRLEFFEGGSHELRRVTIDHSPFKIGRCETSDLRIDSAQVSREHAQIYRRGNIWAIRDLGSTNGTQVNGKPVRESFLADGDILAIAETEVTFVASSATPFQRMATQPIQRRESAKPPALLPTEISLIRARTEAALWQTIPLELGKIVSFASGEIEACLGQSTEKASVGDSELHSLANHASGRYCRELLRRRTIEAAAEQSTADRIFVAADATDFESPGPFVASVLALRDGLLPGRELGVAISLSGNFDPSAVDAACREIRKTDLLLALVGFQGSSGQVSELPSVAPKYLVLCDTMLKGVTAGSQPLRRLQQVLAACQQFGIAAVLPNFACQRTIAQCRQLGYELAIQTAAQRDVTNHHDLVALAS